MDTDQIEQLLKRSPRWLFMLALLVTLVSGCILFAPSSMWDRLGLAVALAPWRSEYQYEMFVLSAFLLSVSALFALLLVRAAIALWDWSSEAQRRAEQWARRRKKLRGLSDAEKEFLRPFILENLTVRSLPGEMSAARYLEMAGIVRSIRSSGGPQPGYEIDPQARAYLTRHLWLLMPRGRR